MAEAARFNPYHGKAGSGHGGQFVSSSGGGGGGKAAAGHGHAPAPASKKPGEEHGERRRREELLAQASHDLAEADALEHELRVLEKQHAAAVAAAGKSAAAAAKAKKAGHVVHHHHHAAHHSRHKHHARTLAQRITEMQGRIHDLRKQAASLEKQARATRSLPDAPAPVTLARCWQDSWHTGTAGG